MEMYECKQVIDIQSVNTATSKLLVSSESYYTVTLTCVNGQVMDQQTM